MSGNKDGKSHIRREFASQCAWRAAVFPASMFYLKKGTEKEVEDKTVWSVKSISR